MNSIELKERLLQELDQTPAPILKEVLDFLLFIKAKELQKEQLEISLLSETPGLFHSKKDLKHVQGCPGSALSLSHVLIAMLPVKIDGSPVSAVITLSNQRSKLVVFLENY